MHTLRLSLAVAALLCACGGGDDSPPPATIDGTWEAVSQPAGSSLSVALTTQSGNAVVGAGVHTTAATGTLVLAVAGTYQAPLVALSFNYSDGNTAVYAATASDATHMSGRLTYKDGTSQDLAMVKQ
ncbi:MAG TPA: hypothetical protein VJ598_09760 [Albitalea sp.]|nr:hypothetical protein [Albitalea sp.]